MRWLKNLFKARSKSSGSRKMHDSLGRADSTGTRSVAPTAPHRGQSDTDDFALSMTVGAATGSTPLGYLAGGSLVGAFVGSRLVSGHASQPSSDETCTPSWSRGIGDPGSDSGRYGGSADGEATSSCDADSSGGDSE